MMSFSTAEILKNINFLFIIICYIFCLFSGVKHFQLICLRFSRLIIFNTIYISTRRSYYFLPERKSISSSIPLADGGGLKVMKTGWELMFFMHEPESVEGFQFSFQFRIHSRFIKDGWMTSPMMGRRRGAFFSHLLILLLLF
jgi:hypothetical protein